MICTHTCEEENEFTVFDFINTSSKKLPIIHAMPFTKTSILVDRALYELDLVKCLRTGLDVKRQLTIDVPRCSFFVDGEPVHKAPANLPVRISRFCTQSVMALPVEVMQLSRPDCIVSELPQPSPMFVHVYCHSVIFAIKKMRLVCFAEKCFISFEICVRVNLLDPIVNVDIQFDSVSKLEDI